MKNEVNSKKKIFLFILNKAMQIMRLFCDGHQPIMRYNSYLSWNIEICLFISSFLDSSFDFECKIIWGV